MFFTSFSRLPVIHCHQKSLTELQKEGDAHAQMLCGGG